jgi:hypothetical protein
MSLSRSCTATRAALALGAVALAFAAEASPIAGEVTHASGLLFAHHASGRVKILAPRSMVEEGETLVSAKGAYALVTLADGSEVTLRPEAQLRIERFTFDAAKPADGRAELALVAGAVRLKSGAIARHGQAHYILATPLGTVDAGESTFIAEYLPERLAAYGRIDVAWLAPAMQGATASDASPVLLAQAPIPKGPGLAPGLHVQVIDGMIHLSNTAGSTSFSAGQFGFTQSMTKPPVLIPSNPGLQFTPPPMFNSSAPAHTTTTNTSSSGKGNNVDCEVR